MISSSNVLCILFIFLLTKPMKGRGGEGDKIIWWTKFKEGEGKGNYNQCYLNFKDLVKDFWGPKFKEKEMGGEWLLKHKWSQGLFQRCAGSVNEDKDGEGDQSWRNCQIKD